MNKNFSFKLINKINCRLTNSDCMLCNDICINPEAIIFLIGCNFNGGSWYFIKDRNSKIIKTSTYV